MPLRSVFILQDSQESCSSFASAFSSSDLVISGTSSDAISAITAISDLKPDLLITDLVLAGYDGLSVIDKVKSLYPDIKIIVTSALCREEIISRAVSQGADYFMAKPVNFSILSDRIKDIFSNKEKAVPAGDVFHTVSLEEKVSKIFINVGIPAHIKGYGFLREGVLMAVEEPAVINNITKELYPRIGDKFHTTPSKVERAIRHAIEVAWNRGRIENINNILGVRAYVGSDKPTNGEFIALIADKMLLEKN